MKNPLLSAFANEQIVMASGREAFLQASLDAVLMDPRANELISSMNVGNDNDFWPPEGHWMAAYRPYIVRDGILHVPVRGVLLNNFTFAIGGWATGYTYIRKAVERGAADGNVKGIALVVDSPGGHAAGCLDCSDAIYNLRSVKPIRTFANETALSGGYWIGSSAGKFSVARTGNVGSIGVVTSHMDVSKAMENAGVKVTFIFAGKHKVDGNPYEPLPADVKKQIQTRIDSLHALFVSSVARNRGMNEKAVRATEAAVYEASEAVEVGLVDAVGAFDAEIASFVEELNLEPGESAMSKDTPATASAPVQPNVEITPKGGASEAELVAARAEGAKAERTRITAIMGLDESKTRRVSAFNLAVNTDLPVENVKALLAGFPEDKVETKSGATAFEKVMGKDNPEVGAGNDGNEPEVSKSARILANYKAAGGEVATTKK